MIQAFVVMEEKDGHEEPLFVSNDFGKAMGMSAVLTKRTSHGEVYSVVPVPSDFDQSEVDE